MKLETVNDVIDYLGIDESNNVEDIIGWLYDFKKLFTKYSNDMSKSYDESVEYAFKEDLGVYTELGDYCEIVEEGTWIVAYRKSTEKKYTVYEKSFTVHQLREEYRNLTGLDNDVDFTDDEIHQYLLEAYKESETAKELKRISVEIEHFNGSTYLGFMLSIKDDGTVDVIEEKDCSVADMDGDYIFGTENDLYRIQADEPISRITYEEIWNCYNDLDSSNEE